LVSNLIIKIDSKNLGGHSIGFECISDIKIATLESEENIEGTFFYDAGNRTGSFVPKFSLEPNMKYSASCFAIGKENGQIFEDVFLFNFKSEEPSCENPSVFTFASIKDWTGNFGSIEGPFGLIGKGAFGEVYSGLLVSREEGRNCRPVRIAVKRMDVNIFQLGSESGAGTARDSLISSFRREVNVLSNFRHPNIVKLLGYSEPSPERRDEPPCLVYELLSLGSLDSQLADNTKASLFVWSTRVNVLLQISTALNYLHCHNPGKPAYHRDVKAANIATTSTYVAKIIDCGLAKYIVEEGTGRSILSATGGLFGTIGYMCPSYCKGKTYDGKCEVYSFGIVILEVLTGKLQNKDGILLEETLGEIPADVRAGAWPEECTVALFKLSEDCTADYRKRIDSMATVMRILREIRDRFCVPSPEETVFKRQMEALIAETDTYRLAHDAATVAATHMKRQCLICYDDTVIVSDGFECSPNRHFICRKNGCFGQITRDQSAAKARFASNHCMLLCTVPGCGAVVPDHAVASYAGPDGFTAFMTAKMSLKQEDLIREYEARMLVMRADLEQEIASGRVRETNLIRHRNHIIDNILTIKCPNPRCQLAFIMDADFDACFALSCTGCGHGFCGWCLIDCDSDSHEHAARCRPEGTSPRGLFPQYDDHERHPAKYYFDRVHGPRRAAVVKAYLDSEDLRGQERETILQAILDQWDLKADNINVV